MVKVQAGILKDITNLIKTVSKGLSDVIGKLADLGADVSDAKETEDGGVEFTVTIDNKPAKVVTTPVEEKLGYVTIEIIPKSGSNISQKEPVAESQIKKAVEKMLKRIYGDAFEISASTHPKVLRATFQRVSADTEGSDLVKLTKVFANYSATEALDTIDAVLSDSDFVASIDTCPISVEICDAGDAIELTDIDEVDTGDSIIELLKAAVAVRDMLEYVSWNSHGLERDLLRTHANEYKWEIESQISKLAVECIITQGYVPHLRTLPASDIVTILEPVSFDTETGLRAIQQSLQSYIDALELYECNVGDTLAPILYEWMRRWKEEVRYTLATLLK